MTSTEIADDTLAGPERVGGQGLDPNREESGNRAIHLLLTHPVVGPQTDLVATYRAGAYEVWAQRGMVRYQRSRGTDGYEYHVIETAGSNPIERQDPTAIATIEEELDAGSPRIWLASEGDDTLAINVHTLNEGEDRTIAERLRDALLS